MKRVIYLPDELNNNKYVLKTEYEGHGIYEEVCPTGWRVHQSWTIVRSNDNFTIMIESYNNMCYDELLDSIDNYNETGFYDLKLIRTKKSLEHGYWVMHRSGEEM